MNTVNEAIQAIQAIQAEMITACTVADTEKNFIIVIDGVSIHPYEHGTPVSGFPHTVERFWRKDAEKIAEKCQNGAGVRGKAVYWRAETEDYVAKTDRILTDLKERGII